MEEPKAKVFEEDGQLYLDDPDALAVIQAVNKRNCRNTFDTQQERVQHFARRVRELGKDPNSIVITIINADDPHGRFLADALMPGMDWQQFRERGEVPFARGLAEREGLQKAIALIDETTGEKLLNIDGLAVVVVDHGTAEVFPV